MEFAIRTVGLSKVYKGDLGKKPVLGLEELNLEVEQGEVYAFLGPNGAGKTTTIKILTRLLFPDKGDVWLFGMKNTIPSAMKRVGYLPEQPSLYGYLSGTEFLDFIGRLFGLNKAERSLRIPNLLERVGLNQRGEDAIRGYSRGMMQRLGMAQALINDPDLLILDEPMASLDPVGRKDFRDLILGLKKEGKTIFFSSHILSDAEMIAERVCILNKGRQVRVGKLDEIVSDQVNTVEVTFSLDPKHHDKVLFKDADILFQDQRVMIRLSQEAMLPDLLKGIQEWGGTVVSVVPQKKTLEAFFMSEVGR